MAVGDMMPLVSAGVTVDESFFCASCNSGIRIKSWTTKN